MWILAFFTRDGEPAAGLSPLVQIRDVDTGAITISGTSMVEKGDGFYGYDFSAYNPQKDYTIICDSVTLSGTERYTYASSGEYNEVLDTIESTVGIVDVRTSLLRKIWTNRLELFDGDTDNWILYDDDEATPLLTFSVSDKSGDLIIQQPNTPSRRSGADGTYSGVLSPDIYMRKSVYDPDNDGFVNNAENVNDGIYTSTASGVYSAVVNSHHPCILGTKCVDETTIGDGLYVKYNAATDRLEYAYAVASGTGGGGCEGIAGRQPITSGTSFTNVTLPTPFSHDDYVISVNITNDVDIEPSVYAHTTTDITPAGFRVRYSGDIDSNNYVLHWTVASGICTGAGQYYTKEEINALIGVNKVGKESLSTGMTETQIFFASPFSTDNYKLFVSLENEIDSISSEYAITITETTSSGFKVHYSGEIDSNNYYLNWYATTSGSGGGNYITEVKDDTSPELGGDLDLGDYSVILNTTPSGGFIHGYTIGWSGDISTMQVDLNDTGVGCPLYMKSNGHWAQCTATSGSTQMPCAALAIDEGTGTKRVLWKGIIRKGAWSWTPGNVIYISTVDGALASTKPTNTGTWIQAIGVAIASDTIRFDSGFNSGEINS